MQSQSLQTAHLAQLQRASVEEEGKKEHIAVEGMSARLGDEGRDHGSGRKK